MDSAQSGWVPGRFRLTKATPANDGKTEQLTEGRLCRVSCYFNSVGGWSLKISCYLSLFFSRSIPKMAQGSETFLRNTRALPCAFNFSSSHAHLAKHELSLIASTEHDFSKTRFGSNVDDFSGSKEKWFSFVSQACPIFVVKLSVLRL